MEVFENVELLDAEGQSEYTALRGEVRRIFLEAFSQLVVRSALLARVAPFVVDERLRVGLKRLYRRGRRKAEAK